MNTGQVAEKQRNVEGHVTHRWVKRHRCKQMVAFLKTDKIKCIKS